MPDRACGGVAQALLTDLYELTMLQAYAAHGMDEIAVFELFFRKLPPRRGFLMAAGLEQTLDYLEELRFSEEDLAFLRRSGHFTTEFVDQLAGFRFTGDVHAMSEGTVFFADEPILRVTAPLPEAQFVETRLINLMHFETAIASKAARLALAAPGKTLVDFGLRRAHGAEAGLLAARAAYIAGFAGTATLAAEERFGIPAFGTMAHSFIQAHEDESLAFERFARARPRDMTLLIDTYDTERAARKVAELAPRLQTEGIAVKAVRIDSGDLAEHARKVRRILDAQGCRDISIFASGGLDEDRLAECVGTGAPIDGFGVGTNLTTSSDVPALDCAYKLQEYAGIPRRKRSEGKATWPGRKQVWRRYDNGTMVEDEILLDQEQGTGEPLLRPVMRAGRRLEPAATLDLIRSHAAAQLSTLPAALARLEPGNYPVYVSEEIRALAAACDRRQEETA
ncbi:MAG TPA: nicotinate phosphoribosyltransferase [Alphaproteobacteria bacterium]|nr:nicotinate phosphoribosyltransferase [Alphaproteobacteria bacterium]